MNKEIKAIIDYEAKELAVIDLYIKVLYFKEHNGMIKNE